MAEWLGDPTARLAGRLTLNPWAHIDLYGSIIVPLITSLFNFTFGWAKPVPYNPYNLRHKRSGELLIAMAGPFSNLLIALIFGLVFRFALSSGFSNAFLYITYHIIIINIILAVFNLIPLPPLDGSKVLFFVLPHRFDHIRRMLEINGPLFMIIAVFFLWQFMQPIIPVIFRLFTGVGM